MGTLIGLTSKAKLIKPNGEIENLDRALTTDAVGTICSSIFGTSTVTIYIESAAGIAMRKQMDTVTAVRPVLPPAAMPAALSM